MYINELFKKLYEKSALNDKVFIRNGMYLFDFEVATDAETGRIVLDLIDPEEEKIVVTQDEQGFLVVQQPSFLEPAG
jgi:hypothetical protein